MRDNHRLPHQRADEKDTPPDSPTRPREDPDDANETPARTVTVPFQDFPTSQPPDKTIHPRRPTAPIPDRAPDKTESELDQLDF